MEGLEERDAPVQCSYDGNAWLVCDSCRQPSGKWVLCHAVTLYIMC